RSSNVPVQGGRQTWEKRCHESPLGVSSAASTQRRPPSVLIWTDRTAQPDHAQPQISIGPHAILLSGVGATMILSGATAQIGRVVSPVGSVSKSGSLYSLVVMKLVAR